MLKRNEMKPSYCRKEGASNLWFLLWWFLVFAGYLTMGFTAQPSFSPVLLIGKKVILWSKIFFSNSLHYSFQHVKLVFFACHWFAMSNSCYNPFIYAILGVSRPDFLCWDRDQELALFWKEKRCQMAMWYQSSFKFLIRSCLTPTLTTSTFVTI